jgi:hypothetical protein
MIYELDKRQLLRLWSVLSSFGEIPRIKPVLPHSKAVAAKR